jgi:hypothetical protein
MCSPSGFILHPMSGGHRRNKLMTEKKTSKEILLRLSEQSLELVRVFIKEAKSSYSFSFQQGSHRRSYRKHSVNFIGLLQKIIHLKAQSLSVLISQTRTQNNTCRIVSVIYCIWTGRGQHCNQMPRKF